MAVTAPFQFARIPRAVWFPEWGHLVSHDVPFADGYSGTIDIEIEAMTPLLIGGERRAGKKPLDRNQNPRTEEERNGKEGEVWPVQLPDGTYAIPGSSLQGMIRNILEIACFGQLGPWVDKRRFGIRDISPNETGKAVYASRMTGRVAGVITPKTKAGWLQLLKSGKVKITPCDFARIDSPNIAILAAGQAAQNLKAVLTGATNAKQRYDAFLNTPHERTPNKARLRVSVTLQAPTDAAHSCGPIWYRHCTAGGTQAGQLVFTGKPSAGDQARRKHYEFVFFDKPTATDILIEDDIWRDFQLIHEPPKGSGEKVNPNWSYWKPDFEAGSRIPIFYLENVDQTDKTELGTVAAMGTAFMFKLTHKSDTHQMLENSSERHCDKLGYDLPSLIFGGSGDGSDNAWFAKSLKRRASFESAEATLPPSKQGPETSNKTVLLGPKPSYFPIYVRQPVEVTQPYASYTPVKRRITDPNDAALARYHPELSGAKVWPSPVDHSVKSGSLPGLPQGASNNVAVKLNLLPEKTKFTTRLHVHNLRKVELGALLWALTVGDKVALAGEKSGLRHRLGMAKPYGMGSVRIAIKDVELIPNRETETLDKFEIFDHFITQMDKLLPDLAASIGGEWTGVGGSGLKWSETVQVNALIEAAKPCAEHPTRYMPLDGNDGYTKQRVDGGEFSPLVAGGLELKRRQLGKDIPVEAQPAQVGGQYNKNGGHHRSKPLASATTYHADKGCPVEHVDGRTGEISKIEFGLCHIRLQSGEVENWPTNTFTVIGPPED